MARQKMSSMTAGIVGTAVGVAVGAAAMALADKNARSKMTSRMSDMQGKATEMLGVGQSMRNAKQGVARRDTRKGKGGRSRKETHKQEK